MTETQRNIADTTFTANQVDILQPSLLFSILSREWGGGLIKREDLLQNLTAKGGLIRVGVLMERGVS